MDLRFPGRSDMIGTLDAAKVVGVGPLMERLKQDIFRGRIRIKQFFADFDPLRSGVVTEVKFRTALDLTGLKLNDPEITALAEHFADPTDPKRVRYEAMLNEIDEVFTKTGLEMDPYSTVSDFTSTLSKSLPVLDALDEEAADRLIERLAHFVKTRQVLIRPTFVDYQKNVNSPILVDQVTEAQFRNGLSQLGLQVTTEEAKLLNKRFAGAADGYVDYNAFTCAVDPTERIFSTREPRSDLLASNVLSSGFRKAHYHNNGMEPFQPGRPAIHANQAKFPVQYEQSAELSELLTRLQDKAIKHRLRVADNFVDADKHGDGTVTQPQFIKRLNIAFDKLGLGFSETEINLLLAHYAKPMRHGAVHVQWRNFVKDIEAVFVTPGMEKDPNAVPPRRMFSSDPVTLTPASREAAVQKLVGDLRKRVDVRRVLVKPLFQDYGGTTPTLEHLTRQQAVQSLSRFGIELGAADQKLLFARYDTRGAGSVDMIALVRDIDPYETFSGRVMSAHVFPQDPDYGTRPTLASGYRRDRCVPGSLVNLQTGRPPTSNDAPNTIQYPDEAPSLPQLISKLQATAVQHRIRVEECFKDFDRHHDGSITVPQFQSAMAMTFGRQTPLSQAESELLIRTYAEDKGGQLFVKWRPFVKAVTAIFGDPNGVLEKAPLSQTAPLVPVVPLPRAVLTPDESARVEAILGRLKTQCSNRRVLVKPFFMDAELNRRSMRVVDHITKTQFGQCLSRLSLEVAADELDLLQRAFDDKGDGFVNYVTFCCAVDKEEQASNRLAPQNPTFAGNFKAPKTASIQPGRAPATGDVPSLQPDRPSSLALADLIRRLQEKVIQFQIPVADFFVDYDKHKMGAIPVPQFRRALNNAFGQSYVRESVTAAELAVLESVYAREMLDGAHFVDWKEMVKDIKSATHSTGLEATPTATFVPMVPELGHSAVFLPAADESKVQALLEQMRQRFGIRSVYVKAPFHDFALSHNSPIQVDHVTRQQFVQGLARLSVEMAEADLELLFRKYDDMGNGLVNYVKFATDVDPSETFSSRVRTAHSAVPSTTFTGGFRKPKVHEHLLKAM